MDNKEIRNQDKLSKAWFYISQVLSIIGMVGVLEDLKSWARFAEWFIEKISTFSLDIASLVLYIGRFIHGFAYIWRSILHPIFDFLTSWFPFTIPILAKDLILVALFVVLGWSRANSLWSKAYDQELARVREVANKYGAVDFPDYITVRVIRDYLRDINKARSGLREYTARKYSGIEESLGKSTSDFCNEVINDPSLIIIRGNQSKALDIEPIIKGVVIVLAIVVLVFLVIDSL